MTGSVAHRQTARGGMIATGLAIAGIGGAGFAAAVLAVLFTVVSSSGGCGASGAAGGVGGVGGGGIVLGPPGTGERVGATEYGGPGDPSSGITGARGDNLVAHPDTYAELGGLSWQTATAMGGLPYMTPLRITWANRSAIAYKRDFGLGGGPVAGLPRTIDLWWQLSGRLGIPYEDGQWSGTVTLQRPPAAGAASLIGTTAGRPDTLLSAPAAAQDAALCAPGAVAGVPLTPGERAQLLPSGQAAAPAAAPAAIAQMIAAGNQIAGKPYVYGGAHGLALSEIAPAYDCSSSVEHVLYGAGLLPVSYAGPSSELESFGVPGPGRWVTVYANPDHVFLYVAGLRWDTHDAAGPGDGSAGIGWHPLIRDATGFVARHPAGL
jgi:cell wall-associated NlpC family hydrolase